MDCNEIRERLDVYAWDGLDGPGTAVVAKHLRHCPDCREELRDIQGLVEDIRTALRHPLPVDRFDELWSIIEEDRRRDRAVSVIQAWRRSVAQRGLAAAAALALCVWLGPKLEAPTQPAMVDPATEVSAAVRSPGTSPLIKRRLLMEEYLDLAGAGTREDAEEPTATEDAAMTEDTSADAGKPSALDGAPDPHSQGIYRA